MGDETFSVALDEMADRFEAAFNHGHHPQIDEYIQAVPNAHRPRALVELICVEAQLRQRAGDSPLLEHYLRRFRVDLDDDSLHFLESFFKTEMAPGHTIKRSTADPDDANPSETTCDNTSKLPRSFGHFCLLEVIGAGAFGTVYRARDERLKRQVAIKVLRGALSGDRQHSARFLREAKALANVSHPGVIRVHEAGDIDGIPFLVMELVEGTTLNEAREKYASAFREIARVIAQTARALDAAHRQGIIHRDIKPSNILIDREGHPQLGDFGLARSLVGDESMTLDGQILGTPAYMSPEQARGDAHRVDARTDVYSLGIVLYELLAGEPPFRGELRMVLAQIQSDDPKPPRRIDDRIPRDLETICLKAIAKDPNRRYSTAEAFAVDLERFLEGQSILAKPAGPWERSWKFTRRNWRMVSAIGVMISLLLMIAAMSIAARISEANRRVREAQQAVLAGEREVVLEHISRISLQHRTSGWSRRVESLVRRALELGAGAELRTRWIATMPHLDAEVVSVMAGLAASSVQFNHDGSELLLGAYADHVRRFALQEGVPIFEANSPGPEFRGKGVAIYDEQGRPWQLLLAGHQTLADHQLDQHQPLLLIDVTRGTIHRQFATGELVPVDGQPHRLLADISADLSRIAIAESDAVVILDIDQGHEVARISCRASAVAFAPDSRLLAVGDLGGNLLICDAVTGTVISEMTARQTAITALAFHTNPRGVSPVYAVDHDSEQSFHPWLLAAGDLGGSVTIWNLASSIPVAYCHGALHQIGALAFNQDGTLLATGALDDVRIWETSTGQCILNVQADTGVSLQTINSLAFSPDDGELAVCSLERWAPAAVFVFRIHGSRPVRTLRGLTSQIVRVRYSPHDDLLVALGNAWEIGIWETASGRLLRLMDVPTGRTIDNAGIAISADGQWLAYSTFREARLWNIASGQLAASWRLPPGYQDDLIFTPDQKLWLIRFEGRKNITDADSGDELSPHQNSVIRLRRLNEDGTVTLLRELEPHVGSRIESLAFAAAGSMVLVHEVPGRGSQLSTVLSSAFELPSGNKRWPTNEKMPSQGWVRSRSHIWFMSQNELETTILVDILSGHQFSITNAKPNGICSRLEFMVVHDAGSVAIQRIDELRPSIRFDQGTQFTGAWDISIDDRRLALGYSSGSISLIDLPRVQADLTRLGIGE